MKIIDREEIQKELESKTKEELMEMLESYMGKMVMVQMKLQSDDSGETMLEFSEIMAMMAMLTLMSDKL